MANIEEIALPIREELKKFETFFLDCLYTDSALLNRVLKYIYSRKGKRIRPLCVFLAAKALSENITKDITFAGATAIEMIHTASIIHDDVIDRSDLRRGNKSVNAEWTSKIAVLAGDYLFSKALMLVTDYGMYDFMSIMSRPICEMSEGEMVQIEKSIKLNNTEQEYFEIIRKKTAVLLGASMEVGAKSVGAEDFSKLMYKIGENIGMAFQIRDDIFDYEKTNLIGKPIGNDIIERKLTLPLIFALKQVDEKKQKAVIKLVKNASIDKKSISVIRDFVVDNKGLEHASSVANNYAEQAKTMIKELKDTPAKQSLIDLCHYVVSRNK